MRLQGGCNCGCGCVDGYEVIKAPYCPGDVLWVRETWKQATTGTAGAGLIDTYLYRADGEKTPEGFMAEGRWHPPCTYLANSGSIRLYLGRETVKRQNDTFRLMNEGRIRKAIKARDFFLAILNAPCKHVAVENPVPSSIWQLPPPTQLIQPYMFGDPYKKKTYLWLRGLEPLKPTNIVEPIGVWVDGGHKATDKVKVFGFRNAKTRSKTFPGIAKAFAEQWSDL